MNPVPAGGTLPVGGAPPVAGAAPPAIAAGLGQHMVARPYRDWYTDNARDPFIGNYAAMYANYDLAHGPHAVRTQIYPNGNSGVPISHLLSVRTANDPANGPGTIQGYHRVTRYQPSLVGQSPFDNIAYAFLGDVRNGQAPHTVIWDDACFNRAVAVQTPTAANLDQLLAADPAAELVGPFAAGDADTESVTVRNAVFIPNRYMAILLDDHLSPRQAWQRIRGALVANGLAQECEPAIDWLRVALTRRAANQGSAVTQVPPATQDIGTLTDANRFQEYRTGIMERDHPDMRAGQMAQGAQLIAGGLNDLATQSRLARESDENRRQRETNKTPQDLFPAGLQKIMRWCQAQTEDQLPQIYTDLAQAKKGNRRITIQAAVTNAMETLGYDQDFPITTKIASRVVDLEWAHQLTDDLSLGLHVFTLGWLTAAETEDVKRLNSVADAMFSGMSAPSVADTSTILDSSDEVRIPRTLAQLRYSVEHLHAFWHVHLGPGHRLTARIQEYHQALISKEAILESVIPRNNIPRAWMPALLARCLQIDCQVWMLDQGRSDYPVPIPSLVEVFSEISRKRDWSPDLPAQYFQLDGPAPVVYRPPPSDRSTITGGTGATGSLTGSTRGAPPGSAGGQQPPRQMPVRNGALETVYDELVALGYKTAKVKEYCASKRVAWPTVRPNVPFCALYHIKHMCNTRCDAAADHSPHSPEESQRMVEWCRENYKVE
jgi:hypothetical protein